MTILYHKKLVKDKNETDGEYLSHKLDVYYKNVSKSFEELEKLYIEPFFHPEKDRLWGLIKMIHLHPDKITSLGQVPR
ncbi:MAG: hypothetical protein JSR17_01625 [Proteobacteria bacterium]|nr:hypothetical protein [Pseudomonadota bacterium]